MATNTKAKKTTKKTTAKAAPKKADLTIKECMAQSQVLKLHMTVITILSFVICALVVALVLALKD